jgi:S-adenosylmethionine hydrolase
MRRIVVVTDCKDVSFSEMCGRMHGEADALGARIHIEQVVPVENFSEINAAFLTRLIAENYPPGTVIYTLVSKSHNLRNLHDVIWGETLTGHIFIGSNFGYFGWLARDLGVKRLFELKSVPQTSFSGKTYIAPIVARIAAGDESDFILHPYDEEDIDDVDVSNGAVVHIDNFGNIKVMDCVGELEDGDILEFSLNGIVIGHGKHIRTQIYLEQEQGCVVLYRSTSFDHMVDLGMVRGDLAGHYGICIGDVLTWRTLPRPSTTPSLPQSRRSV